MSHHRRETDSPDISLLSCSRLVTPSCISYYLLLSIGTNSDGLQSVSLWSLNLAFQSIKRGMGNGFHSILFDQNIGEWGPDAKYMRSNQSPDIDEESHHHHHTVTAYKDEAKVRPVTRDLWDCQVSLLRVKDQIHSTTFIVIFLKYVCIYNKYNSASYRLTWFDLTIIYWFITSVDHSDNYDSAARKCWYLPWLASYISAKRRSIMSWCLKH